MNSLSDINIISNAVDPIEDTKNKIKDFWVKENKPHLQRCDSSIKINNEEKHILMYTESKNGNIELIIEIK